jgi:hypothetical protein
MKKFKLHWLDFSLLLCAGLLLLGQLQRIELGGSRAIYGHDLVMILSLGLWAIYPSLRQSLTKIWQGVIKAPQVLLVLVAWVFLGWSWAALQGDLGVSAILYGLRFSVYGLYFWVWWTVRVHKTEWGEWLSLIWPAIFVGLGLLQYVLVPDLRWLRILGWDDHYYRLVGTWLDPVFTGLGLIFGWWWLRSSTEHPRLRLALNWATLGALLLTYSRTSYVAWILSMALVLGDSFFTKTKVSKVTYQFLVASVVIFIMAIPFLPRPGGEGVKLERVSSITARANAWDTNITQLHGWQWWFGRGAFQPLAAEVTNTPGVAVDHGRQPDTMLLWIVTNLGIGGTLIVGVAVVYWWRWVQNQPNWLKGATFAWWMHAMFAPSLVQPLCVCLMGIMLVTRQTKNFRT